MDVDHLDTLIGRRLESAGWPGAIPKQLRDDVTALMAVASELQKAANSHNDDFRGRWAQEAAPLIKTLDDGLRAWHRYIGLGL